MCVLCFLEFSKISSLESSIILFLKILSIYLFERGRERESKSESMHTSGGGGGKGDQQTWS